MDSKHSLLQVVEVNGVKVFFFKKPELADGLAEDRKVTQQLARKIETLPKFCDASYDRENKMHWMQIRLELDLLLTRVPRYGKEGRWNWVDLMRWKEIATLRAGDAARPLSELAQKLPAELPPDCHKDYHKDLDPDKTTPLGQVFAACKADDEDELALLKIRYIDSIKTVL